MPRPEFTDPAFDPTSCTGTAMTHAEALARWNAGQQNLGSYQMVFRDRRCDSEGCGPWQQIPLSQVSWATAASGIAQLVNLNGVMNMDLRNGICENASPYYSETYLVGARCSGVGATLTCEDYNYPGICRADGSTQYYEVYNQRVRFLGTLTDTCLRLESGASTLSGTEIQAGILVHF
jgi:hypothetical protein